VKLRDIPAVNQLLGPGKQPPTTLQLEFPPPNKALLLGLRFSNLAVLVILVTYFAIFAQGFATVITFTNILNAVAAYLLVALGETFVLIGGGIDLSVGSMLSLGGVAAASYMSGSYSGHGSGLLVTIGGVVVGAGLGLVGGVFNGAAISYLKLNPLIVTLGTYGVFLGGADLISNGVPITNLPPASFTLGNGTVFHVPYIALIALGFAATLAFVAKNTRFGRYTFAVGANRESVRRAGVNLNVHSMMLYGLAGMLAGLAGMLNASQFAAASSAAGANVLLVAIAAVVIGGTPITGGEGKIWGTVIGALIYTLLQNGFVLMNKSSFWQLVIIGFLIIGAVYVDEYQRKLRIMTASGAELTGVAPPDLDAGPRPPTTDGSASGPSGSV
jgi:ribose transport system permease protein